MKKFNLINNVVGWIVFLIATAVYVLTIEPTASFWDCGEFITTAFKLEVGHPPGAPLFMIVGRVFTLLAGGDVTKVPVMINIMSALASSFTILFLFWSITHIARRIIEKEKELESEFSVSQLITIMGTGVVGALAYTFSDTFWFSAVEGEVYASSSLFTALVFWAILKWENAADKPYANRWIILIAYMMGLSIGVHLLNLLAIPAIVFVYYFRKYKVNRSGILAASGIAIALLIVIMYIIIPHLVTVAGWFELLFVNSFGLPFNSGIIVYATLLIGGIVYAIYYTYTKGKVLLNTIVLGVAVIIIGYSSFAMIVIRSAADTPMDQNSPDNVFALKSYLNREQYGDRPLFRGQTYASQPVDSKESKEVYTKIGKKYVVTSKDIEYVYNPEDMMMFPRMYSNQPDHTDQYKSWSGAKDNEKPTQGNNMAYLFRYQINFMYIRYFMWNFVGRQNDIQGNGEITHGNWITGIPFLDAIRLGPQDKLPKELKNNKGRNVYYGLPLLLGLLGLFFLFQRDNKYFWVVMLLFFFTGLAIVLYLNQPPLQPRERDYAYAGSFYAFAIYIGFGVMALVNFIQKITKTTELKPIIPALISAFVIILVPGKMAAENWDDHDRSNRYTCRDFAHNYLMSCEPNAIIFTNGDNDTFPLWYAQEVEGIRTDVRVINLSYLSTDWYIEQMERKAYQSEPVPFSLKKDKIIQGKRDVVYIQDQIKGYEDLRKLINFVASDDPNTKLADNSGSSVDYLPTRKFSLYVDSATVVNNKTVSLRDTARLVKSINWELDKNTRYLRKSELMVLDLLANNNWKRPVYFAITVGPDSYLNLEEYFQLEGLAYRIVPIRTKNEDGQIGRVNTERMYDLMMNKFKWGGIDNPKVYLDENNLRMTMNIRNNFARLANQLLIFGQKDKAIAVLDKCVKLMPNSQIPYNYYNLLIADAYYKAGAIDKANEVLKTLAENTYDSMKYYFSLEERYQKYLDREPQRQAMIMQEVIKLFSQYKQDNLVKEYEARFNTLMSVAK